MKRLLIPIALMLLLTACEGMALRDAELQDSPEAYEAFLQEYPASTQAAELRERIDKLRFLRAKSEKSSEAMRDYMRLHPDGKHVDEARTLEDDLSYKEAAAEHTAEAYQAYLDSHPDGARVEEARWVSGQLTYLPMVGITELVIEPINMANDPKGPLNGYGLSAVITNNGDRSLRVVEMAVDYQGADGKAVKSDKWWAVAPDLGGFPTPPEMKPTLHPTRTRTFSWSTAETPDGYLAGRFGLRVTKVEFLKD